jgi:hypothetical protein
MSWLTSLPLIVLVPGWLLFSVIVALASRWVVRRLIPTTEWDQVSGIAGPLMPALGATFAVLMAVTLSSEAGYLRSAQDLVSNEAAQASRLAWAATNDGVGAGPLQGALLAYLDATRTNEWHGEDATGADDPTTATALAALERVVRIEAARKDLGTPIATELLTSLDALTIARRARLAAAARGLPELYVLTILASGLALVVNGGALAFRSGPRTSVLVLGLAVVVGLSMALLFALTGPWDGALQVSGQPIDSILHDLRSGFFSLS